ncbi:MAG: PD40 domain-containing protein [Planctomycetales bacterium]|nr:PD40 domain-containing protein [Planctomycetales bacterium]
MDVTGPTAGQVVDLGCGLIPSWSPNNEEIAFMLHPNNPNQEREGIWIMKADGTGRRRLTDGAMPTWSPRRNELACVSGWSSPRDIFLVDVDTGAKTWLFPVGNVTAKSRLAWWPDGDHIVFAPMKPQGNEMFWIASTVGADRAIRTLGKISEPNSPITNWGYPTVSPDGKELVFPLFSKTAPLKSLCRLSVEPGSSPVTVALSEAITSPGNPVWAPDGQHLAFIVQ